MQISGSNPDSCLLLCVKVTKNMLPVFVFLYLGLNEEKKRNNIDH